MALQETIPWIEKYRPRTLADIINQEAVVTSLQTMVKTRMAPHMLFAGPPGVGKTATAHAFAADLFGPRYIDDGHFLEINASDERGIDVIREKVKGFARTVPMGGIGFKILLLDEADMLTADAQHAFRRVMEQFSATCRFILAANYANRIIEPIQSRCAVFKFKPIEFENVKLAVERIANREKLRVSSQALKALYEVTEGDLRRCINILQTASTYSRDIDDSLIYQVAGIAWGGEVRRLMEFAVAGKLEEARNQLRTILYVNGASERDLIGQMYREIFYLNIPEHKKLTLISLLGEVDFRLSQGATPELQLMMFLTHLYAAAHESK